ncbi:MAG: aspartate--tRNA(Asn) ligase, partial [Chitinophagaceae bacterium]|nr:aspartate--tRNA(Asn) ligase [Anaerolineae bacterium]
MQERIWTTHIGQHIGERVRLSGWLHRLRQLSNVSFLILRDSKGLAQIVIEDESLIQQLHSLYGESVLHVEGIVTAEPQAPGGVEIRSATLEVVSSACTPPPFDLFRPTIKAQLPTILDHAAVALRHPRHRALFRISAASMSGFRASLQSADFVEIQTPKIVGGATESGATVFEVDYFGKTAYLAQSPQLYKQIMVGVFERVYEIGPVFRAEPHDTPRHLNQYVSMDIEMGFIENHHTVMAMLNHVLRGMVNAIQSQASEAVDLLKIT